MKRSSIGWAFGAALAVALLVFAYPLVTRASGPARPATAGEAATGGADANCVACHTSEETLRALAVEPEAKEKLSEGEG